MKILRSTRRLAVFTLVELLVVIAVVVLLASVLIPGHPGRASRERALRLACVNQLREVSLAVRTERGLHATGQSDSTEPRPGFSYFQTLSNHLASPRFLACPADKGRVQTERFATLAATNISYFISLEAGEISPQMALAGDRNLAMNGTRLPPGPVTITSNSPLAWTDEIHRKQGNVALADGSVQSPCQNVLQVSLAGAGTNRLIMP